MIRATGTPSKTGPRNVDGGDVRIDVAGWSGLVRTELHGAFQMFANDVLPVHHSDCNSTTVWEDLRTIVVA